MHLQSEKMNVRIVSRKLIKPSIPTPNHLRTLRLSFIDQLSPSAYGSFIFYYLSNGNNTISEKIELLENSLSETLIRFYPLAGRFIEDRNSIDCNDQGAECLIAQVGCKLSQFLDQRKHLDAELLNRFIPFAKEVVAFSPTVLAVQLNVFDCGRLAIGVSLSHKVADGFVISSFIQGWAAACRFGNINEVITSPSFEMGSLLPARDTNKLKIPVPEKDGTKMVTKRFVFDGLAISTLKAKAIGEVSRVVVVTAVLWKARILVAQAKHGLLRPSLLNIAYNLRGKTGLKIPKNSFGNAFKLVIARFKPSESKLEFNDLVSLLGNSIRETASDCSKTEDADDLFTLVISSMREIHEILERNETDICVFTSVCGFPYYEADFGWGKPSWISSVHKPSDIVLMMDTKCGRGIEAWVTLEEKDMLKFQQDEDIVAFNSGKKMDCTQ